MKILSYPHPALTTPTKPWDFSAHDPDFEELLRIVDGMHEALRSAPHGVALAANQVGLPHRIFVVEPSFADEHGLPTFLVNPHIVKTVSGTNVLGEEGCLSFPGTVLQVKRLDVVGLGWWTTDRKPQSKVLEGFPARVVQHECEHLDGKTFLDSLDRVQRYQVYGRMVRRR